MNDALEKRNRLESEISRRLVDLKRIERADNISETVNEVVLILIRLAELDKLHREQIGAAYRSGAPEDDLIWGIQYARHVKGHDAIEVRTVDLGSRLPATIPFRLGPPIIVFNERAAFPGQPARSMDPRLAPAYDRALAGRPVMILLEQAAQFLMGVQWGQTP